MVANVRQLRNTFNTAAELPSDIIVMIPLFLPEDFDSLALSHVCRRWRTIVNSAPLLWRRMDCRDLNRTVIGLEHLKSTSLRLKLNRNFSTDALNTALDRGCNIASVIADISLSQIQSFHKRLVTPSVEELVLFIYGDGGAAREGGEPTTVNIEGEFTSMRRLFISGCFLPIDRVAAANLIHLSLESFHLSTITAQSVLNMLRGCLRVETVLINTISGDSIRHPLQSYKPVTLPKLHSIELGHFEVCSGLIIPLHFPQGVAVGFRSMCYDEETWPCESIRHTYWQLSTSNLSPSPIFGRVDAGITPTSCGSRDPRAPLKLPLLNNPETASLSSASCYFHLLFDSKMSKPCTLRAASMISWGSWNLSCQTLFRSSLPVLTDFRYR